MFQHLWRILIMAVIAVAAFFVVSSLSLSNRLDEGESFLLLPGCCPTPHYLFFLTTITFAKSPSSPLVKWLYPS
jgi:hypothetical protein